MAYREISYRYGARGHADIVEWTEDTPKFIESIIQSLFAGSSPGVVAGNDDAYRMLLQLLVSFRDGQTDEAFRHAAKLELSKPLCAAWLRALTSLRKIVDSVREVYEAGLRQAKADAKTAKRMKDEHEHEKQRKKRTQKRKQAEKEIRDSGVLYEIAVSCRSLSTQLPIQASSLAEELEEVLAKYGAMDIKIELHRVRWDGVRMSIAALT